MFIMDKCEYELTHKSLQGPYHVPITLGARNRASFASLCGHEWFLYGRESMLEQGDNSDVQS